MMKRLNEILSEIGISKVKLAKYLNVSRQMVYNYLEMEDVNFISEKRPKKCTAKFRYRQSDIDVTIEYLEDGNLSVKYDNVKSVTPGQACVLYLGEECLGGGIIKEVRKDGKKLWYL